MSDTPTQMSEADKQAYNKFGMKPKQSQVMKRRMEATGGTKQYFDSSDFSADNKNRAHIVGAGGQLPRALAGKTPPPDSAPKA